MATNAVTTQKITVLVVSSSPDNIFLYSSFIQKHLPQATIYTAADGFEAMNKINNAPPTLLVMEFSLQKLDAPQFLERVFAKKTLDRVPILIISALPNKELFMDELVSGRVQFIENPHQDIEFDQSLKKALAFHSGGTGDTNQFYTKTLATKQQLMKEGDPADSVYIVKKGKLRAYKYENGKDVTLGFIQAGEFVGEMAYLSGKTRTANVEAEEPTELVEVPVGTFDRVLNQRPAWSKALMATLAKRVKNSNSDKP